MSISVHCLFLHLVGMQYLLAVTIAPRQFSLACKLLISMALLIQHPTLLFILFVHTICSLKLVTYNLLLLNKRAVSNCLTNCLLLLRSIGAFFFPLTDNVATVSLLPFLSQDVCNQLLAVL